jgi:hypothetical protein
MKYSAVCVFLLASRILFAQEFAPLAESSITELKKKAVMTPVFQTESITAAFYDYSVDSTYDYLTKKSDLVINLKGSNLILSYFQNNIKAELFKARLFGSTPIIKVTLNAMPRETDWGPSTVEYYYAVEGTSVIPFFQLPIFWSDDDGFDNALVHFAVEDNRLSALVLQTVILSGGKSKVQLSRVPIDQKKPYVYDPYKYQKLYIFRLSGDYTTNGTFDQEKYRNFKNWYCQLSDSNVNLRESCELDSKVLAKLQKNDKVLIVDFSPERVKVGADTGYWIKVETLNRQSGWIWFKFLAGDSMM